MITMKTPVASNGAATYESDTLDIDLHLHGTIIRPGDEAYDEARKLWNGMIDKHPAIIARCVDEHDVIASVAFARKNQLSVAVRGGGHNVAGLASCDGGIVIDLSEMKRIVVDPEARVAYAQPGVIWGELDNATQQYGLATPGGVVSDTGIAGLTLGGGMGWLRRKHGLSCDALVSVDVVTANGRLLHASETENADLFWGVRGGGGNFGIVTNFAYQLYPLGPDVFFNAIFYPGERIKEVLRFCNEYVAHGPDEVSPLAVLGHVPHDEAFPAAAHGKPFVAVLAMYAGAPHDGERALQSLRNLGDPIVDMSGVMPYGEVQTFFDADYPTGMYYYWKSANLSGLTDDAIDALIAANDAACSHHSTIDVWFNGGAMARVPADATAFGDRSAPILIGVEANWEEATTADANIAWARNVVDAMQPFSDGGVYLNFPGFLEEGEQMMRGAFGKNYPRLVELKNKYDPMNVFALNQNIKPSV